MASRRAARTDRNQIHIVEALRDAGAVVQSLATVGQGCPDLLVGFRGSLYLLEVKDGAKPPSARKLTPAQEEWRKRWPGYAHVVGNALEALVAVKAVVAS